mmetsp:Transcript_27793/g.80588  ORF Transcript_27793/g.80588 Transcript_27793/m.80588 type:complete len:237 (-) Transcript_27793:257-967(-)
MLVILPQRESNSSTSCVCEVDLCGEARAGIGACAGDVAVLGDRSCLRGEGSPRSRHFATACGCGLRVLHGSCTCAIGCAADRVDDGDLGDGDAPTALPRMAPGEPARGRLSCAPTGVPDVYNGAPAATARARPARVGTPPTSPLGNVGDEADAAARCLATNLVVLSPPFKVAWLCDFVFNSRSIRSLSLLRASNCACTAPICVRCSKADAFHFACFASNSAACFASRSAMSTGSSK